MDKVVLGFSLMLAALFSCSATAQIRFEAPLNASAHRLWSQQSSEISCVLSYAFPEYGRADFVMLSGANKQLSLEIFPLLALNSDSQMRAVATPPEWKFNGQEEELARIKLYQGFNPFFGNTAAWRMLGALAKGKQIMLPFTDTKRLRGETVVPILSPLGFNRPFQDFLKCQQQLLDYGFKEVRMVALHFNEGSSELTHEAEHALQQQINYVKQDPSISSITLRTFAFERKLRDDNLALAKERAATLRQRYEAAGVSAALIKEEAIADRQLRADDLTAEQRRNAARAIITLSRDPYKVNRAHEVMIPDIGIADGDA